MQRSNRYIWRGELDTALNNGLSCVISAIFCSELLQTLSKYWDVALHPLFQES